ncbi:MAG: DNA-3-methyladenine glycosylase [Candidatus Amoebophilus sp. 36-38]|nr:MAG: DNA-3-methyladenine glycosylase [Candidatus Amoebophilus sp. 36-38]
MLEKFRCSWVKPPDFYIQYHDEEWGVPVHQDQLHFELFSLGIAQAGLNFRTVLAKREGYRKAFVDFDISQLASFEDMNLQSLYKDPSIIRNKNKILATINNARVFLELQAKYGSFDAYIWDFVSGRPIVNYWHAQHEVPSHTPLSDIIAKDMKQKGFKFVGTTSIYAYMQSAGLVNDHLINCFRYQELVNNTNRTSTKDCLPNRRL